MSKVTEVEWDIVSRLDYKDHFAAKCVGDASFVENVWVAATTITNDDPGSIYKGDNILHYGRIFPNVVCASTPQSEFSSNPLDSFIDWGEIGVKRHHCRHQSRLDKFRLGYLKDRWAVPSRLEVSQQHPEQIGFFDCPMSATKFKFPNSQLCCKGLQMIVR
ncbi:hypothetical protein [Aminobacter ciceronei]|uniref:Uncharacterized protein n=1 Tax=Aminobacter ciceronei TaxID=150723 RepID=A0ABR6CHD6_9HYPH|nr:hypothetical protein [Aminobacter ciceronei]MBA8910705.1 hypothetical protein [Aminobacter ciceronei]MBA9024457.1 hypothetical protein [Aminobacter ciceronei]